MSGVIKTQVSAHPNDVRQSGFSNFIAFTE